MNNEIEIVTKFCHPYMNFGGDGCNDVVLKVPQAEAVKLQSVTLQKGETVNYSDYKEFFLVSFSVTLSFWLIAVAAGTALRLIRRH